MRRSSRSVLPTCSVTSATVPTPRRYLCGVSKPGSGYVPLNDPNPRPPPPSRLDDVAGSGTCRAHHVKAPAISGPRSSPHPPARSSAPISRPHRRHKHPSIDDPQPASPQPPPSPPSSRRIVPIRAQGRLTAREKGIAASLTKPPLAPSAVRGPSPHNLAAASPCRLTTTTTTTITRATALRASPVIDASRALLDHDPAGSCLPRPASTVASWPLIPQPS